MTVVPFFDDAEQRAAVPRIAEHLRGGGLLLYPTETVFGLGGLVEPDALDRLASLKTRDETRPFLLLVSDRAQVPGLDWNDAARRLADALWPGPVTLVLASMPGAAWPPRVTSASGGVALRETPHAGLRLLLDALAAPITSTSANARGAPPAANVAEARALLGGLPASANVWLLDGEAGGAAPSTVVDCTTRPPRLLRAGAIPIERIREVVHDVEV